MWGCGQCASNVCLQKQKAEMAPEAEKPAKKQPPSEESGDVPAAVALHNDIVAQGVFCVFCMTSTHTNSRADPSQDSLFFFPDLFD